LRNESVIEKFNETKNENVMVFGLQIDPVLKNIIAKIKFDSSYKEEKEGKKKKKEALPGFCCCCQKKF